MRLEELNRLISEPGFWDDAEKANATMAEISGLKNNIEGFDELQGLFDDIGALIEMAEEENDASMISEIGDELERFKTEFDSLRISTLLSGPYDKDNAIITLHAGAGGTEACDWTSILMRAYTRWAESKGYKTEVIDYLAGEEAGVKSCTIEITGTNAYGYLKSEHGVHRLVRISPFNAAGKRQTSFVSCDVMPDIETDIDIEIREEDIKMEVFRASGAGGQHINKTSSAVRLIHIPTGFVAACQEERSQLQNKNKAMQMLKTKLYLKEKEEQEAKLAGIRGEVKDNGWGSQIRSYVLQPYRMVKDLRTGEESGNTDAVLDGDIDRFISAYLKWMQLGCPDRKIAGND